MKAEDMPTPEVDRIWHGNTKTKTLWETARSLEQRLGVATSNIRILGAEIQGLSEALAVQTATAQFLRLIVERAVDVMQSVRIFVQDCIDMGWERGSLGNLYASRDAIDAFLAEIGARSAEAIQERK